MIIPLLLAILIPISPALAGEGAPAEKAHPNLVLLEQDLTRAQDEKREGTLTPEQYSEWVNGFRTRLSAAMERIPPSPVNQAAHARVTALLGERKAAHAALDQALEANPEDPVLLRTKGQLLLEQNDFAAAAEHAKQAWEKSGKTDKSALALYYTARGRVAPTGAGAPPPNATSNPAGNSTAASSDDPSKPYKLPAKGRALPSDVPAVAGDPVSGAPAKDSGPGLLTMLGVGVGVLLIAWGALPSETKERLKQDLWERPKQELKVIAAGTAVIAVAYGGYLALPAILGAGAPTGAAMTPALAGGGTTGGGILLQQTAVGTAKAAIVSGGAYVVGRGALDHVSYAKSESASGNGDDDNPFLENQKDHIFRKAEGHVADTPENRKILAETAKSEKHFIGEDKFGNKWFSRTQPDGRQSWVKVRNGKIENGGINNKPLTTEQILGNKGI